MASVDELRLVGPVVITSANTTKLTVPAVHKYVVKQLILCNTNGIDAWVSLAINGVATTAANCLFWHLPLAASDTMCYDTAIVLNAGDTIQAISDLGGVNLMMTGWDHSL